MKKKKTCFQCCRSDWNWDEIDATKRCPIMTAEERKLVCGLFIKMKDRNCYFKVVQTAFAMMFNDHRDTELMFSNFLKHHRPSLEEEEDFLEDVKFMHHIEVVSVGIEHFWMNLDRDSEFYRYGEQLNDFHSQLPLFDTNMFRYFMEAFDKAVKKHLRKYTISQYYGENKKAMILFLKVLYYHLSRAVDRSFSSIGSSSSSEVASPIMKSPLSPGADYFKSVTPLQSVGPNNDTKRQNTVKPPNYVKYKDANVQKSPLSPGADTFKSVTPLQAVGPKNDAKRQNTAKPSNDVKKDTNPPKSVKPSKVVEPKNALKPTQLELFPGVKKTKKKTDNKQNKEYSDFNKEYNKLVQKGRFETDLVSELTDIDLNLPVPKQPVTSRLPPSPYPNATLAPNPSPNLRLSNKASPSSFNDMITGHISESYYEFMDAFEDAFED